jgi:hypothetical protein
MPTPSQVHIETALTNVSVAYENPAYVAEALAPPVPVRRQSDKYYIFDPERERFRAQNDLRAPGAEADEVNFSLSSDAYFCADHALESAVPDEERENADPVIQPEIDRTEFLTEKILLNQEVNLASAVHASGVLPGVEYQQDADRWDDPSVDPVAAVELGRTAIQQSVQAMPNTLVLSYPVYQAVRANPKVIERVKYVRMGIVGPSELAQLFDVDRILVARAFQNTAPRGRTASLSYIWGKDALLCYVPPRPAMKTVALAYTFVWTLAPGSLNGRLVESWREERRKADMIRVQKYYDQKLIAPSAGYLWQNAAK